MIYITILLIIILLVSVYTYLIWNFNHWKKLSVPYVKPELIFGNLKDAFYGKTSFGLLFADFYSKFPNVPYIGYLNMRSPAIILRDPELIKSVLVKNFSHFESNDFEVDPDLDPIMSTDIFSQSGDEWKKNRSAWTIGLTSGKLKLMINTLNEKSDLMIQHLKNHVMKNVNEPIEIKDLSSNFFIDVIVKAVFGLEFNSFLETENNYYKTISTASFESTFWEGLCFVLFMISPRILKFLNIKYVSPNLEREATKIAREILNSRQKYGLQKDNSLDVIISNQTINKHGIEKQVAGIVYNFLVGGTETSARVTGFALYELAKNVDVQVKLKNELDTFYRNNKKITYENLNELEYLEMILSETLRLYPTGVLLHKRCTKTFFLPAINSGNPIKVVKGSSVTIPVYGLHMDPDHFPDPERFDPERFGPNNKGSFNKYAYLPFGEGPRKCIGIQMAMNQMKVAIAGIVKHFEIRLAPKMKNTPLIMDPNEFMFKAVDGLWIEFRQY